MSRRLECPAALRAEVDRMSIADVVARTGVSAGVVRRWQAEARERRARRPGPTEECLHCGRGPGPGALLALAVAGPQPKAPRPPRDEVSGRIAHIGVVLAADPWPAPDVVSRRFLFVTPPGGEEST